MNESQVPVNFSDVVSDVFGHVPVVGVLKTVIQQVFKKRLQNARNILLDEMKSGSKDITDAAELEEVVAIIYRYGRAAQEGNARLNLRILAQIIAGQKQAGILKADEFLYYADIISSLRYEEIVLLGCVYKYITKISSDDLKKGDIASIEAMELAKKELVPVVFKTNEDWNACCGAIIRTGLLSIGSGFGALVYRSTSLMDRLYQWASFEDALEKEAADNTK